MTRARLALGSSLVMWVASLACSSQGAPPSTVPASPTPPVPTTPARGAKAPEAPGAERARADLSAAERGFGALDPSLADAIEKRMHAYPETYLDEFRRAYVEPPATAEEHARRALADILGELRLASPRRVRRIAGELVLRVAGVGPNEGLRARVADLEVLHGGVDEPVEEGSSPADPDEVCRARIPGRTRRPAVMVRRDCTCGETMTCTITLAGETLTVASRARSHHCTDCTRAFTTCSFPALAPTKTYKLAIAGGRVVGTVVTDGSGSPRDDERCVRIRPGP